MVNQRTACMHGMFWDVRLDDGPLAIESDDGTNYATFASTVSVNDGNTHNVVFTRIAGTLTVNVDGTPSGSVTSLSSFASLAPLAVGTDTCIAFGDGTVAFSGTLGNVCVTSP